jgi:hypothetical protein
MEMWLSSRPDRFIPRKEPPLPIPYGTSIEAFGEEKNHLTVSEKKLRKMIKAFLIDITCIFMILS